MKFKWEVISDDSLSEEYTFKARVEGGWLYKNVSVINTNVSVAMTFVPDNRMDFKDEFTDKID